MSRGKATPVPVYTREGPRTSGLAELVAQVFRVVLVFGLLGGLWAHLWVSSSPTL